MENSSRRKRTKVGETGMGVFGVHLVSLGTLSKHIPTFTHTEVNPSEAMEDNYI